MGIAPRGQHIIAQGKAYSPQPWVHDTHQNFFRPEWAAQNEPAIFVRPFGIFIMKVV